VHRWKSATVPDSSEVSASAGAMGGVTSARVGSATDAIDSGTDAMDADPTRVAMPSASASRRLGLTRDVSHEASSTEVSDDDDLA
jgi:hypothetical protein